MAVRPSLLSGAVWSLAEGWINQALQFLIFLVLAHYLAPAAFGLAATAILLCQLLQNILLGGIHMPLVRAADSDPALDDTGFWMGAGLGAVMLIALLAGAGMIERVYGMPGLAPILQLLAAGAFCAGLSVAFQARLMRRLNFRLLAIRSLIGTAAGGFLGLGTAVAGGGVLSLAVQFVGTAAVGLAVLVFGSDWRPSWRWRGADARQIARFGGHVSATGLVNFFNENADVLIVGHVLGPGPAGLYFGGKRVVSAANALLAGALTRVAVPAFAQVQDDPPRAAQRFLRAVASSSIVAIPAFIGLALIGPEFIAVAFGAQWKAAVPVLQLLCLHGLLQSLGGFNHAVLLAFGKPHWQTLLTLLYAVTNVVLLTVAVRWGLAAVAAAYMLRAYLYYPLSLGPVMRLLPVRLGAYVRALAPPLLAAAVMAAALLLLLRPLLAGWTDVARAAALIALGVPVYATVLLASGGEAVRALLRASGTHRFHFRTARASL